MFNNFIWDIVFLLKWLSKIDDLKGYDIFLGKHIWKSFKKKNKMLKWKCQNYHKKIEVKNVA